MDEKSTVDEAFDLGAWEGRRQAFALVAGRCLAADAQILIEIREKQLSRTIQETDSIDPAEQAFAKAERAMKSAFAEFQRLQALQLDDEGRSKLLIALASGRNRLELIHVAAKLY
jgi:hypothetical protein